MSQFEVNARMPESTPYIFTFASDAALPKTVN